MLTKTRFVLVATGVPSGEDVSDVLSGATHRSVNSLADLAKLG